MIIAVDFDGTLVDFQYPYIGKPNIALIKTLINLKKAGHKLILWTCRVGNELEEAESFCKAFGLEFNEVNKNLPESIAAYGSDARKVLADIYVDDKGIQPEDFLRNLKE
jgi:hypothetical protein